MRAVSRSLKINAQFVETVSFFQASLQNRTYTMEIDKQPLKLCNVRMYELMVKDVMADLVEDKLNFLEKSEWIHKRKKSFPEGNTPKST